LAGDSVGGSARSIRKGGVVDLPNPLMKTIN
jgi:hypothetical protein